MLAERSSHTQRQHRDVLAAAHAGDAGAFRVLVEPHRAEIYSHCSRMFGSVHDADDAFQDAMLRAWRGLSGLLDGTRLRPWLYMIATNACVDAINATAEARAPDRLQHVHPFGTRVRGGRPIDLGGGARQPVARRRGPAPNARSVDTSSANRWNLRSWLRSNTYQGVSAPCSSSARYSDSQPTKSRSCCRQRCRRSTAPSSALEETSMSGLPRRARHLTNPPRTRQACPRPRRALHRRTRSRRCRHDPRHAHTRAVGGEVTPRGLRRAAC